jgi:putative aldouronate transport system substrate-binding protein
MCKKILRVPAMALVLTLAVSLGAFAGGGGQQRSSDLTILTTPALMGLPTGIQEGYYWTEILKEDLGIVLNAGGLNTENIQAVLAAGDLTDIVVTADTTIVDSLVKSGQLLNLDDHKAKLPNMFTNGGAMIQYMRDNVSNGTGKLYMVRDYITNISNTRGGNNYGPFLRWDYYKELGYPEIVEMEDYLPVLKAMLDRHPVNENGQKNYGISLWNWGPYAYNVSLLGHDDYIGGFQTRDLSTGTFVSVLDDNGPYKRSLKFYFTANQMGILDPDSMINDWATVGEKVAAGRYFFMVPGWNRGSFNTAERVAAGSGFMMVPFKKEQIYSWATPYYTGGQCYLGINGKSKNLEKALEYLDYYYSWDGVWQLKFGRKGVAWDLDEKGEPYLTELGWRIQNGSAEFPNGGKFLGGLSITTNETAFREWAIHPVYKRRLDTLDWVKKDFAPKESVLEVDWKRVMNAEDDLDYFTKNNMILEAPYAPVTAQPPEEIQLLSNRINEIWGTACWKMIFAKDEAEFNALWVDVVSQANGMGIDRVSKWYQDAYNEAKAAGAKYMY